ncbi:MAG: enoyl-CoA hydratase/isomerase family protein [Alphaproteobacteria bacterium]|nr:MAG: enoyl-CoA hydratase/isomerase family protein [Alphaproteobacteria bacterium]
MADEKTVLLSETEEGIGFLRFNRPEIHNAFNAQMTVDLIDALEDLKGADHLRCLFIEGAGKSFSAGADLNSMKRAGGMSHSENMDDAKRFTHMLIALRNLPMPTVALVNGAAMGGGLGIVAACDIAVAVKDAIFSFSEVRLGLIPAMISPFVVEAIGPRQARRYFATGERFYAHEAQRIGLIHEVVDDMQALSKFSERLADDFMHCAPGAVRASRELIDSVIWREMDRHMIANVAKRIADRRASAEGQEGMAAFLEKRKPSWTKPE